MYLHPKVGKVKDPGSWRPEAIRERGIQSVEAEEIKAELRGRLATPEQQRQLGQPPASVLLVLAASSKNLSSMDQFRQCCRSAAVGECE